MTNSTRFLETESALKALTDELATFKAASEQIETARDTAQTVTDMAMTVTKNGSELLVELEAIRERFEKSQKSSLQKIKEIDANIESINGQVGEISVGMKELGNIQAAIDATNNRIDEFVAENAKRDEAFAKALLQLSKNSRITQIIVIAHLGIFVIAIVGLLLPPVRAIFIR